MSQRLPEVIEEFVAVRLNSEQKAKNTVLNERRVLDKLLAHIGPIQVRHVTGEHIDQFFAAMASKGLQANTLNLYLACLKVFFAFAIRRGYTRRSPVNHRKRVKPMPRERLRVPVDQFPHLLAGAGHPRDRMLIAVGLFLWLRQGEAVALRLRDVDLSGGEVAVKVFKTRQIDRMPISAELDSELRRWLTIYGQLLGRPLEPDMYLIPARGAARERDPSTGRFGAATGNDRLKPYTQLAKPSMVVHGVLRGLGYPTHDPDTGKSLQEGMHTLRRSGARARYDFLVGAGYDGALREVQAGLHHSSTKMTEHYLGITLDSARRSRNIKGKSMFGYALGQGNVVELKAGEREQADDHRDAM